MLGITYETANEKNLIRFPHATNPTNLFFLESGKDILFHNSFSKTSKSISCWNTKYNDPMHFYCEGECYHINQFAEIMARNGHTYEPAEPIQDLTLFAAKYLDRDLKGEDDKLIPYRMVWCNNGTFLGLGTWFDREMPEDDRLAICICPEASPERQVCLVNGKHEYEFMSTQALFDRMNDIDMAPFERRQIQCSAQQAERQSPAKAATSFEDLVQDASQRAAVAQQMNVNPTPEQAPSR